MKGHVTRKGDVWYAVIYEGVDPVTGKERRRWHRGGGIERQPPCRGRGACGSSRGPVRDSV